MAPGSRPWSTVASRLFEISSYHTSPVNDYTDVLVPLEEAHLYSYAARVGRRSEYEPADDEAEADQTRMDEACSGDMGNGERRKHRDTGVNGGYGNDNGRGSSEDDDEASIADGMLPMRACEYSIEGLRKVMRQSSDGSKEGRRQWTEYELKSKLINKAIQDIGMGRYNWQLFFLCGFGWFADNLWMQGISLILPSLSAEFGIAEKRVRYTTSALFLGLCFGSFFWGVGSDVMGRRLAFNCTLLITSIFGTLAAYGNSWGVVCLLVACLGFGVGGNLPVDGALFLEFLPDASSSLLTLLSVWWPVGQLCSSLLAWQQIVGDDGDGTGSGGWRRFVTTIGLLTFAMFFVRFFVFRLFESPKFLLSCGREGEAVAVIHGLAYRNGTKTWLTEEILEGVAAEYDDEAVTVFGSRHEYDGPHRPGDRSGRFVGYNATSADDVEGFDVGSDGQSDYTRRRKSRTASTISGNGGAPNSTLAAIRDRVAAFSAARLRPLFQTRQLAVATALMWFVWATIGMGYPLFNAFLPQYLSHSSGGSSSSAAPQEDAETPRLSSVTYRNYAIASLVGVPGSLLAAYSVDNPSRFLGRRGTLASATLVSAVFLFLFAAIGHASPGSQLLLSCIEAFAQNIMYGVLYAFTPEMFPAPVRGAGTGVASFLNRVTGLIAPVIAATLPGDGATGPVLLSAALILSAFFGMVLIPIETRGRQRL